MTTPVDLDRLDALHRAATPGPWEVTGWEAGSHGHNHDTVCIGGPNHRAPDYFLTGDVRDTPKRKANHDLIAALRNSYKPMAAEIRALRAEVERLRAVRDAAVALLKFASRWEDGESHHYYCGIACAGGECDCGGNALRAALDAAAGGV